ncbi:hypothetical protein DL96DRAFT_1808865 [Flagelloscypha sp. PMI_526]|nr:hypothetical protein DL96DRAFT_1808865 [Flagelloscypha sp. PMI_526]
MYKFTLLAALLVASVSARSVPLGRRQGRFITAPCTSDAGCDSGCCGFTTGKCAGNVIALQRDGGCGFGDAQPNRNAAAASGSQVQITPKAGGAAAPAPVNNAAPAAAPAPAAGGGGRFITAPCTSDAGCDSGCCGFKTGKCAGNVIALQRDGGCGFGDAAPNRNAAAASGSQVQITP